MKDFEEMFGGPAERDCYGLIFKVKYPEGFYCNNCLSKNEPFYFYRKSQVDRNKPSETRMTYYSYRKEILILQCKKCNHQTSVTSNTIFHGSRLPVSKWFKAINYVLLTNEKASPTELKKYIYTSYATACLMITKIKNGIARNNPFCDLDNYID